MGDSFIVDVSGYLTYVPYTEIETERKIMKMLKQSLIGAVVVVVLMALVAVLFSPAARAQIAEKVKTSVVSVLVVNTALDPVPIAGTVSVANNPLSVQDINEPLRQPYQTVRQTTVGNTGNARNNFEVPAGKRLVIEQITALVETSPATCNALYLNIHVNNAQALNFPVELKHSSTFNLYVMSDKTSFWADQDVSFEARTLGACEYQQVTVNVSGYLVDQP